MKRMPAYRWGGTLQYVENGATSIRRTFKLSKNEKLFNAPKEFHISDYFHLLII